VKGGALVKSVRSITTFICFIFLLTCFYGFVRGENIVKANTANGNIIGFVYAQDGTTPLNGAVVKFLNISTNSVYESSQSDTNGIFKINGIETGLYIFGVITPQGDFILDDLVGVRVQKNETAKLSISLTPYNRIELAKRLTKKSAINPTHKPTIKETDWPEEKSLDLTDRNFLPELEVLKNFAGIASVNAANSAVSFNLSNPGSDYNINIECCSAFWPPDGNSDGSWSSWWFNWLSNWWNSCGH